MSERRKTVVAAAVLAASVGVYAELAYQEKLKEKKQLDELRGAPPAPASSVPRPPGSSEHPK
jgi:hypothetical protein